MLAETSRSIQGRCENVESGLMNEHAYSLTCFILFLSNNNEILNKNLNKTKLFKIKRGNLLRNVYADVMEPIEPNVKYFRIL